MSFPKVTPQKTLSETVSQFQDTDTFLAARKEFLIIISKTMKIAWTLFPPKQIVHINTDEKKMVKIKHKG